MDECTIIDGSLLEGGGQVLRNSISLSALLRRSIHIQKIRHGRGDGGGLRAQHLCGMQLVQAIVGGRSRGAAKKSKEVWFYPSVPQSQDEYEFTADTHTAGSVCLLMQVALPVLLFLPGRCRLTLKGGTNAIKAPVVEYAQHVQQPMLRKLFGIEIDVRLFERGYYPKGGGHIRVDVEPVRDVLQSCNLVERGELVSIEGMAVISGKLPAHIGERIAKKARNMVKNRLGLEKSVPVNVDIVFNTENRTNGVSLFLKATTSTGCVLGASALGERRKSGDDVAKEAAMQLVEDLRSGACVDRYFQDQIIIFMALCSGSSQVLCGELTLHTRTSIHWCETLLGVKFTITPTGNDKNVLVACDGIGYKAKLGQMDHE